MFNLPLIILGKSVSTFARFLNLGNGSTWPGHIALNINKTFTKDLIKSSHLKLIFIAGTNGKTTTATLIRKGLEDAGKQVIQNESGANLLNGVASTLLLNTNTFGKLTQDYAIFEIDENALPKLLNEVTPDYLLLLNLFRDQLDRYGEVDSIVKNWRAAIKKLPPKTTLILNADDPQIAYLGETKKKNTFYFGLKEGVIKNKTAQHAADSVYCPKCEEKLSFKSFSFSHLGDWYCNRCGLQRPRISLNKVEHYPLPGIYNQYNTLAAALVLQQKKLTGKQIAQSFFDFKPAFGRQEIIIYKNRNVQLFLSKNPTSFNQSYITIKNLNAKILLIVLNDRIPDGRDISWVWDIDLPDLQQFKKIFVSGDRVYDIALRIKYELGIKNYELRVKTHKDLYKAIDEGVNLLTEKETLFVLPTYSAMLEVRKILTGKKIL